jgi:hypothetical protein
MEVFKEYVKKNNVKEKVEVQKGNTKIVVKIKIMMKVKLMCPFHIHLG